MNDPYPPQILIVIGNENENKVIHPATLIGIHAGLPAYRLTLEPPKDRFTADTERAMELIRKAFEG